jgi:hypothetical protein
MQPPKTSETELVRIFTKYVGEAKAASKMPEDCVKSSIIFSMYLIIHSFLFMYSKNSIEKRPET